MRRKRARRLTDRPAEPPRRAGSMPMGPQGEGGLDDAVNQGKQHANVQNLMH